jgi:hypothetical protein
MPTKMIAPMSGPQKLRIPPSTAMMTKFPDSTQ